MQTYLLGILHFQLVHNNSQRMSQKSRKRKVEVASPSNDECDWEKCIFCQKVRPEKLVNPAECTRSGIQSFERIQEDLRKFKEIGCTDVCIDSLCDQGKTFSETCMHYNAKFHKTCRNRYDNYHFERKKIKLEASTAVATAEAAETPLTPAGISSKSMRSSLRTPNFQPTCIFCEQSDGYLRNARSYDIDRRVRHGAVLLSDDKLIAKLCEGDMHAVEAKYHAGCLCKFYNRVHHLQKEQKETGEGYENSVPYNIVLSETINFIKKTMKTSDNAPVFVLSELKEMFSTAYHRYTGSSIELHSTRFKEQLLSHVPGLQAHKRGRQVILTSNEVATEAILAALSHSNEDDGMFLVRAAKRVRQDLFNEEKTFDGNFDKSSQINSVPKSLLLLIQMLLEGTSISLTDDNKTRDIALGLSQLIKFNAVKKKRGQGIHNVRHRASQETPLPVYIGLLVHSQTRKKGLVRRLSSLGLSISYNRVDEIQSAVTHHVCDQYQQNGLVRPSMLVDNVFTTAAIDNIDHNATSNTSSSHFHGTSLSLFQHPNVVVEKPKIVYDLSRKAYGKERKFDLPLYYSDISPEASVKSQFPILTTNTASRNVNSNPINESKKWLKFVDDINCDNESRSTKPCNWAAYNQENTKQQSPVTSTSTLLPLINESINSPAMVKHCMMVIRKAIQDVNPGQVPVITADQPVYALLKQIQWKYPNEFGEKVFVVGLGGLHIEMAMLATLGDWLQCSEWTELITKAKIRTSGSSEAVLSASHVKKSRYVHQVNAAVLYSLLKEAFDAMDATDFEKWISAQREKSPHFEFWYTLLEMECLMLMFVKSVRDGNFEMFVDALDQFAPWMFALDHTNYARWLPVYIQSLNRLPQEHPEVYEQFLTGRFTVQKTQRLFSRISDDQAHEQNNKVIKGSGGAVGIFDSPISLMKWMISGPEIAGMLSEFEDTFFTAEKESSKHENTATFEAMFQTNFKALKEEFKKVGNPFEEESENLYTLVSKILMGESACKSVYDARTVGTHQYSLYKEEVFVLNRKSIYDTIKRNKFSLYKDTNTVALSKTQQKVTSLKQDCQLYSSLYIACQRRDGDLDDFFSHENHAYPPSLSVYGELRGNTKSDTLKIMDKLVTPSLSRPECTAEVLDGAAIVHTVAPKCSTNFGQYCKNEFTSYLLNKYHQPTTSRVDIVFDVYSKNSIKALTRTKRGYGNRVKVTNGTPLPRQWKTFLRVNENKSELFQLLAEELVQQAGFQQLVTTNESLVLTNTPEMNISRLAPCNHEEADTRIFVHVRDLAILGHKVIVITTVDTDVVVIAISCFQSLVSVGLEELWVAFGTGVNRRWIPIHVTVSLGRRSNGILFWYAFTGCDTVSGFGGKGKLTAWEAWRVFEEITPVFIKYSQYNSVIDLNDDDLRLLERYTCILYERTTTSEYVNECRRNLFAKYGRPAEAIPPTKDALIQHIKRAVYQARVWCQATMPLQTLPSVENWGWTKDYKIVWMTLPEVSKALDILKNCGCQKGCKGRYSCKMGCSALIDVNVVESVEQHLSIVHTYLGQPRKSGVKVIL